MRGYQFSVSHTLTILTLVTSFILNGCAADFQKIQTALRQDSTVSIENTLSASYYGTRFTFNYADYYSLTDPSPFGCAGDLKTYNDPLTLDCSGEKRFPQSTADSSTTLRPAFIKNVSVDMTDTNAPLAINAALSCSRGNGPTAPPISSCATFDSGGIDGIPSGLGGVLISIGGIPSSNVAGFVNSSIPFQGWSVACGPGQDIQNSNTCSNAMYALNLDAVSSSTSCSNSATPSPIPTPISTPLSIWSNLTQATSTGPPYVAGAAATYDPLLKKLLLFGGASPLSGLTSSSPPGTYTYDSWIYNLKNQTWTVANSNANINSSMLRTYDFNINNSQLPLQWSKSDGGRTHFGFISLAGSAISKLSSLGTAVPGGFFSTPGTIDTTDRIFTVGGYGGCVGGVCSDTHRFNPTYGPEYFDSQNVQNPAESPTDSSAPIQWIDSYPTQILSNSNLYSMLPGGGRPSPSPLPTPSASPIMVSMGMVGLNNHIRSTYGGSGVGTSNLVPPLATSTNFSGASYLMGVGGFYGFSGAPGAVNRPSGSSCSSIDQCGGMTLGLKWFNDTWSQSNEHTPANFTSITNYNAPRYGAMTPLQWHSINDGSGPSNPIPPTTPWFGGAVLLPGLDIYPVTSFLPPLPNGVPGLIPSLPLNNSTNQVVYFGGSDCRDYLVAQGTQCPNWDPGTSKGNPGRYWIMGPDPAFSFRGSGAQFPNAVRMDGKPPYNAGMAAARGTDKSGNPLIVAWGGMKSPGQTDNSGTIYYLYANTASSTPTSPQTPTWASYVTNSGPQSGLANAAMVFSHVTKKFYLFGGYSSSTGTVNETWELSLESDSCGQGITGNCKFTWRSLNSTNGLTCYPNCPPARRSHRMVETNYHYFNPPYEPTCSASRPCSFGIFMQGGSSDAFSPPFSDRWMFDPTAHGGAGHWQNMGELPPRTLASLANVDYEIKATGEVAYRAILFGGETGLQNPLGAASEVKAVVPPTLGDTWMYDYKSDTWNRVGLFGHRYDPSDYPLSNVSELEARSSSTLDDPSTEIFSPPPLAGAIMVTRTLSKTNHSLLELAKPLKIPEIFLIGGRKKDGYYNLINNVFKFCAGSTGEKPALRSLSGNVAIPPPDDASCDAYDTVTNPDSLSPVSQFVGRWLAKKPQGTNGLDSGTVGSFMGAGAYDSNHDLIVVFGGLQPNPAPDTMTGIRPYATTAITDRSQMVTTSSIYEYTPPSALIGGYNSTEFHGHWERVSSCLESPKVPTPRYGHSVSYDSGHQSLVVVGGYDFYGNPLHQSMSSSEPTKYMPEIWTAVRIDGPQNASGKIPAIRNTHAPNTDPPGPFPCYYWSLVSNFNSDSLKSTQTKEAPGIAHPAAVYIPPTGYNTGFYTTNDSACIGSGPISTTDSNTNKLLVGGAYFDIDRSQLTKNETLILHITFLPLGPDNLGSDQNFLTSDQTAIFKVHLIKTGESGDVIRKTLQPRNLIYAATDQYPVVAPNISVFGPPYGQIREEQIIIPLFDQGIDRIRLERYSGNAILIKAALFRTKRNE